MSTEIIRDVLNSSLLGKELPYRVLVPEKVQENGKSTAVLYLLHGLFGNCDNWLDRTSLLKLSKERRYIIVLPEAEHSWYVDSEAIGSFESFFLSELIPAIDIEFRTTKVRGIAGLSMGGYGAVKFVVRRPELFRFAVSCSGAFHAPQITDASENWGELKESVMKVFGPVGSETRDSNDLEQMIGNLAENKRIPPLFLDCGLQDSFLQPNREMSDLLKRKRVVHTYTEFEGGHDWGYWNARLESILTIADAFLS